MVPSSMQSSKPTIILSRPILFILMAIFLAGCASSSGSGEIIGRWEDTEAEDMHLEFRSDGSFVEYFFGERVGSGEYEASGGVLTLHYSRNCGGPGEVACNVRLRFTTSDDTLIITDAQGDLIFRRVR